VESEWAFQDQLNTWASAGISENRLFSSAMGAEVKSLSIEARDPGDPSPRHPTRVGAVKVRDKDHSQSRGVTRVDHTQSYHRARREPKGKR